MKRSIGSATLVIALTSFATLAEAQTMSVNPPHYSNAPYSSVINLGTLGGSVADRYGGPTNNGEWVSGDAYLPGNLTKHAVLWRRDVTGHFVIADLGTLPVKGLNSSVGQPQKNDIGLIVRNS
jgi:hypothetical protein